MFDEFLVDSEEVVSGFDAGFVGGGFWHDEEDGHSFSLGEVGGVEANVSFCGFSDLAGEIVHEDVSAFEVDDYVEVFEELESYGAIVVDGAAGEVDDIEDRFWNFGAVDVDVLEEDVPTIDGAGGDPGLASELGFGTDFPEVDSL